VTALREGPDLPGMRCIEKLGSGGFSDVFLYEQDHPRLKVAVKLLKSDVLDDNQRRQFAAEADVMAELAEHPFIVPVLGAGTAPDGRPYLAMRYFPPPDLGARVAKDQMSVPDALRTGIQLASAVETAHRSGIIHRDIKPANVLVSSYGVPALSDFGIAGRGDRAEDDDSLGVSMPWSPPEVLTGKSNGSAASDVYSLAATIWHLLVGRSPFSSPGDNGERALFSRILHGRPPAVGRADAPTSLDRLLQQAMAKDPAHRPRSALEFARHLQRVEQELRLARTEIVVLETEELPPAPPEASYAPPATPAGPVPAQVVSDDDGITMMKRPVMVRPSAPAPAVPPPPPASELTERRVPDVVPSTAPSPAQATEMRPAVVTPTAPAGPTPARTPGPRRGLVLAAVAVVVLAGGILAALLASSGDEDPSEPTPSAAGPSDPDDVIGGGLSDPIATPTITVRTAGSGLGQKVTFVARGADSDVDFRWTAQADGVGVYAPQDAKTARLELPVAFGPTKICVHLQLSRDGSSAGPFEKCWTP
jgi:serine/threonine protein kinase